MTSIMSGNSTRRISEIPPIAISQDLLGISRFRLVILFKMKSHSLTLDCIVGRVPSYFQWVILAYGKF